MAARRIRYFVPKNAKILFVGINPHYGSYRRGVPFSNNKTFWYNLSRSGLIEKSIDELRNDKELRRFYTTAFWKKYRFGFINLIDKPTRDVSQLKRGEEKEGVTRLYKEIKKKRPKAVCFIGKVTYEKFKGKVRNFRFGMQDAIEGTKFVIVIRFPIRGPQQERIKELKKIKKIIEKE
ncbi:MAG: uracil-DNA glycosylase family protein [Candidatus Micrarchaeaceae archaeon]